MIFDHASIGIILVSLFPWNVGGLFLSMVCWCQNSSLLLEQVNLFGKENNTPNELSGGERQRVAIARAMSNNPSCLIMDEPTGNLDTKNVENFMTLLMDMVSIKNVTLLIATHDTKVSSRLDRLLSLE